MPLIGTAQARDAYPIYPLTALVGQDQMRLALVLNAISPDIGGVLLHGDKGSAKSTAARALAALLPPIEVVDGCPLRCDPASPFRGCPHCHSSAGPPPAITRATPLVELPLGASEDRVLGSIELERTLQTGRRHFEPGLLAAAHRAILYIDEVNLLPDHLVDLLLDVAAMGINTVEREGFSFSHPARFLLIGTMNPEEGELRPQFLDRFGLSVQVSAIAEPEQRAEVVRRRIAYEADPHTFVAAWQASELAEQQRIQEARARLAQVAADDRMLLLIAHFCTSAGVEGLRADLVIYKTARALAAYAGRTLVLEEDVRAAAALALPHRRRRRPFEEPGLDDGQLEQLMDEARAQLPPPPPAEREEPETGEPANAPEPEHQPQQQPQQQPQGAPPAELFEIGAPPPLKPLAPRRRSAGGRRGRARPTARAAGGRAGGAAPSGGQRAPIAFAATIRAAAPHQRARRQNNPGAPAIQLHSSDLQVQRRLAPPGRLILFLVDASGSMAAQQRMSAVKGAILALLQDAYCQRDHVALIAFRGVTAEVLLPPTRSVEQAQRLLAELPTGGRTPLAHGLQSALQLLSRMQPSAEEREPLLVLLSDGRANVPLNGGEPLEEALHTARQLADRSVQALVVDSEVGYPRLGLARQLSEALGGEYVLLEALEGEELYATVRRALAAGVESRG